MKLLPLPYKKLFFSLAGLIIAWVLLAGLVLPQVLKSQATRLLAEKGGYRLTLDTPQFNPFTLRLDLTHLRLADAADQPLLSFRALSLDLSATSLLRRAVVFDAIQIDAPQVTLVMQADGRLNWALLMDALKSQDTPKDTSLPRVEIDQLKLSAGQIAFTDQKSHFATQITPLDFQLSDISTLFQDTTTDQGRYQLSAQTATGARLSWQGEIALNQSPIAAHGHIALSAFDLAKLSPYLKTSFANGAPTGILALATDYHVTYAHGQLGLTLNHAAATLEQLRLKLATSASAHATEIAIGRIEARNGQYDLASNTVRLASLALQETQLALPQPLRLGLLSLSGAQLDLAQHRFDLEQITAHAGQIKAVRDAAGQIDLVSALKSLTPPKNAAETSAPPQPAPAWHYRVGKVALTDFAVTLQDRSVSPAAEFALQDIAVASENISDDLAQALPVQGSLRLREGGRLAIHGQVTPNVPQAQLQIQLTDLSLQPAQPYLGDFIMLKLASGKLNIDGTVQYDPQGPRFNGGFALRDVLINESTDGAQFLALKSLATRQMKASTGSLQIPQLTLDGLDTQLHIDKDKSINVSRLLRHPTATATPSTSHPPAMPDFFARIDRLRISNSQLDFADHSLSLPFGTRIHHLRGAINGLSTRASSPGQIELNGQVDDYGLARFSGQIDLSRPTQYTDLKVIFRNVEMSRLTPYSATFAGRKITSGKLSLDLEYKIKQRLLAGDNKIIMDKLTLGERVDSPTAQSLPLDLAIALLEDSDGRIDLGLPVSGSLDDPQFSYGGIIWKAIVNILGKIATAPFRALGALLGGGEKNLEQIEFEPGTAYLTPPEREKLQHIATAMSKRPGIQLNIAGLYATADRALLQDRQLRLTLARRTGQQDEKDNSDPGPLSTGNAQVQQVLEQLYTSQFGNDVLRQLKDTFQLANPGQLEESMGGRLLSRLTSLAREPRILSAQELDAMKGANFYTILFDQLRSRVEVTDAQLLQLAQSRAENVVAALKKSGIEANRVSIASAEKTEISGGTIPLKLSLGTRPAKAAEPEPPPGTASPTATISTAH